MTKSKVLAVVGPTASGKTSLAIKLAQHYNGEVISADSRQVYRGLDIGTAKVTQEEMQGVPHHLLDIADLDRYYTGQDFVRDATAAITDIASRGKVPIIAGGTFFYLDLLQGKLQAAPVAPNYALRETLEKKSTTELFQELTVASPHRAEAIDPHNRRRLIRALEIIDTLGDVPPVYPPPCPFSFLTLGIMTDREVLRVKYLIRAENWLQGGLREEIATLFKAGISRARIEEIGFEYTLMLDLLDGKLTEAEYLEQCVQKNWQYAKRQLTWLKRDPSITWIKPDDWPTIETYVNVFLQS